MSHTNNLRALGEVASIRTGYTFRGKIEEVAPEQGNAHIVQIKDARKIWDDTQSAGIAAHQLPYIRWEGKSSAFIEPETLLLPARGGYFRAAYVVASANSKLPVVASSQLLIIKPHTVVLPEFLCWTLNQPRTQFDLTEASQGTNISMLRTATLQQLKIAIPPIHIQQKVLHLNQLWEQEQQLTLALLKNREAELQAVFQQLITAKTT